MSSFEELISKADEEFEKAWEQQISISTNLAPPEETNIALRKLISYNPSSDIIKDYDPKLKTASQNVEKIAIDLSNKIAKDPKNENLWLKLGYCYMLLDDYANAHASFAQVKAIQPTLNDPSFWFAYGTVEQHFQYYKEAYECFNMVTKCTKELDCPAEFNYRLACLYRSLKKYEEALVSFESIKDDPPQNLMTDDILFQMAFTHQSAGKYDKALQMYQDLYQRHPECLDVIQQFTWFLSYLPQKEHLEYGKKILLSLSDDYAQNPRIKLSCARILMKLDDLTEAYSKYCKCLTFWNDNPIIWAGLSELYYKNSQLQDSLMALRRVIHLNPCVVEAWLNLAFICEKLDDKKMALNVITSAYQQLPNSPEIYARYQDLQKGKSTAGMIPFKDTSYFSEVAERIAISYINSSISIPIDSLSSDDEVIESIKHLLRKCDSIFR